MRPETVPSAVSAPSPTTSATARFVPIALLNAAYGSVAVALCWLVLPPGEWRMLGVSLAIASAVIPARVASGWLLLVLGAGQLFRGPSATDYRFFLLLAGLPLLHLLSSITRVLPWRGALEAAALGGMLKRFALLQCVAQPMSAGALLLLSGRTGTVPGLSLVSAVLVVVLAQLFARWDSDGASS